MRVTQLIPLADIIVTDRLRKVDPDRALFIATSMKADGLDTPIEVRPAPKRPGKFILVKGGHRVEAAHQLGWDEIEATVLDLTADQARMREIDENLYRVDLTELDRAVFLSEKKRLWEKLHPAAKHGGDRKSDQAAIFGDLIPRFTEEVAERLGLSERSLQRTLARAKLEPAVRARIANTPMADKGADLDALLKLAPEQRMPALDLLLGEADDAPRTIAEASQRLSGARISKISDVDAQLDTLMKAWRRAGAEARSRFAEFVAEQSGEDA